MAVSLNEKKNPLWNTFRENGKFCIFFRLCSLFFWDEISLHNFGWLLNLPAFYVSLLSTRITGIHSISQGSWRQSIKETEILDSGHQKVDLQNTWSKRCWQTSATLLLKTPENSSTYSVWLTFVGQVTPVLAFCCCEKDGRGGGFFHLTAPSLLWREVRAGIANLQLETSFLGLSQVPELWTCATMLILRKMHFKFLQG